jgi:hypothetical protein
MLRASHRTPLLALVGLSVSAIAWYGAAVPSAGASTTANAESTQSTQRASSAHKAKPKVKVAIPHNRVNGGAAFRLTWKVTHRPRGSKLLLQRRQSAQTPWKKLRVLKANHGGVTLHAPKQGRWTYSVAIRKGKRIVKRAGKPLFAFRTIGLADTVSYYTESTTTIDGAPFNFVREVNPLNASATPLLWVSSGPTSSCRWVKWDVATGATNDDDADTPVAIFSRAGGGTKRVAMGFSTIHHTARLPVALKTYTASYIKDYGYSIYLNATLNCFTPNGLRP